MSEGDLLPVSRTLDGDNTAFDELVERYCDRVFRSAMNKLGIREEAVDITQEAFVRAYMSLHSLKNPERFGPWLMVIVGNLCKMRFRSTREMPVSPESLETVSAVGRDPRIPRVVEALESLPDGTRTAASMFFVEGLEQQEIATRLGISLPAVRSRVREARLRLRKEMVDMAPKPKSQSELGGEFASELKRKLELARWFKEIADHLTSGGDVMTGLEAIAKGGYSAPIMDATVKMMDAIRSGKSVSSALADIPVLASPEAPCISACG